MEQEKENQPFTTSLDSLREAGCKHVSQYLPGYNPQVDSEEVFGVTRKQFERAFELEWIRRGRPENALVTSLYLELERMKDERNRTGLHIDAAVYGRKRSDEPPSLTKRLDMVRALAAKVLEDKC